MNSSTLSLALRMEAVCNRFEVAWRVAPPNLAEYLVDWDGPDRVALLRELIPLDLHYRHKAGQNPDLAEYQARFPELASEPLTGAFAPDGSPETSFAGYGQPQAGETRSGTRVGEYEILGEIARGGMGVVFLARQPRLNRLCALKMILAGAFAGAAERRRFETEAQAIAQLQHPGIVQVFEIGEHEGQPFLALEYCAGGSLNNLLARNPLEPRKAAELVRGIAVAIQAAHQANMIHRDLKPGNVLLADDGTPKVTDFGLARMLDQPGDTRTGTIIGTPSYMPPEQASGKKEVGPAADIYSIGAILYECLTGRPPFKAATVVDTLLLVVNNEPVAVRQLNPSVPFDLATICHKCLQKSPSKRYSSAKDLADDLERYLAGKPIMARPVGVLERTVRWCRRNTWVAALVGLTATLLVVIAVGGAVLSVLLYDALRKSQEKELEALVSEAGARRFSRMIGQRFGTLEAIRKATELAREQKKPPATFDKLRNLAIAALALPDLRPAAEWISEPNEPEWRSHFINCDPLFRRCAVVSKQGDVSIRRIGSGPDDNPEIARIPGLGGEGECRWSPDGRFLAVWHWPVQRLKVYRADGETPTLATQIEECGGWPEFSPDGRLIVTGRGKLRVYVLPSGRLASSFPLTGVAEACIAPHPRLAQVAIGLPSGVLIADLATGKEVLRLPTLGMPHKPAWHPDGELLAVGTPQHIHILDVPRARRNWELEHRGGGLRFAFNPTGDLLVSTGWSERLKFWNPHTGREVFGTSGGTSPWFGLGNRLAAWKGVLADGKGSAWPLTQVEAGREYRTLVAGAGRAGVRNYVFCDLHPDGRLLAVGTQQGLSLMDIETGTELQFVAIATLGSLFEPSGALLTCTPGGVVRWPVQADRDAPHHLRFGPPESVPLRAAPIRSRIARSADGSVLAATSSDGAQVWHRDRPHEAVHLRPHGDCRTVAVSPNGQRVATGAHNGKGLKVWNAQTGILEREFLPHTVWTIPYFSPDGRWLFNKDGQSWRTADWSEGPKHPTGTVAFSPDGKLAAWGWGKGFIPLTDPDSGRELARLADPNQDGLHELVFSPDGTKLIGVSNDNFCVRVWDLRKIRQGLVELGLDWDTPPYPAAAADAPKLERLQVEVIER